MKTILWILAGVGAFLVARKLLQSPAQRQTLLTQAQRDATNNATLWAYSQIMPPIAQLDRVPFTGGNARLVDPVVPSPYGPTGIYQNGGP